MENSERFDSLVAKTAKENGSVFFVDSGEGRELETETMSGEGLFGWLMQIRPTAFTISLIIHFPIALFYVYTELWIDSSHLLVAIQNTTSVVVMIRFLVFLKIFEFISISISKNSSKWKVLFHI